MVVGWRGSAVGTQVIYSSTCCLILQGSEPGAAPSRGARWLSVMNVCERAVSCDKKTTTDKQTNKHGGENNIGGRKDGWVRLPSLRAHPVSETYTQDRDEDPGRSSRTSATET